MPHLFMSPASTHFLLLPSPAFDVYLSKTDQPTCSSKQGGRSRTCPSPHWAFLCGAKGGLMAGPRETEPGSLSFCSERDEGRSSSPIRLSGITTSSPPSTTDRPFSLSSRPRTQLWFTEGSPTPGVWTVGSRFILTVIRGGPGRLSSITLSMRW